MSKDPKPCPNGGKCKEVATHPREYCEECFNKACVKVWIPGESFWALETGKLGEVWIVNSPLDGSYNLYDKVECQGGRLGKVIGRCGDKMYCHYEVPEDDDDEYTKMNARWKQIIEYFEDKHKIWVYGLIPGICALHVLKGKSEDRDYLEELVRNCPVKIDLYIKKDVDDLVAAGS